MQLPSSSPGTLGSTPAAFNTRGFFDVGYSGDLPIQLADVLELDTATDKFLDSHRRGGKKGDLTSPLKERKPRWLFNHWWTGTFGESDGNFIWYDHTGGRKCVTYQPTHEHLWTLAVDRWLLDDIVNAYAELLAIREVKLWNLKELQRPALQYFFAASYFMPWAGSECTNFSMIDPLRDEKPTSGREIYPLEFYIMEKFLPYMLFNLNPDRFRPNRLDFGFSSLDFFDFEYGIGFGCSFWAVLVLI
ncbi:hypothetical protein POM88_017811 [Heracleum sosnowskyi]|uniref:Uncharacterized protein n=1 Tax=Heracleum sosnowskyi TaxID=360622 RepID=A0AAD8IR21_9APIA|nr:hypothetical protein POM88_017811 [Heracleum sosnowskyi]